MKTALCIAALGLCVGITDAAPAAAEQPVEHVAQPPTEPSSVQAAPDTAPADPEPSGAQATYRVIVEGNHQETGVAISKDGLMVASGKVFDFCPQDGSACAIHVGDSTGRIWYAATLIARDSANVIALLRVNGEFPGAATLRPRSPQPREPLHVLSFDGRNRSLITGKFVSIKAVSVAEQKPKTLPALMTDLDCRTCSAGDPVFSSTDDRLLGIYLGALDGDGTANEAFLPAATIQAFVNAHKGDKPAPAR